jgi:hypothetical protein
VSPLADAIFLIAITYPPYRQLPSSRAMRADAGLRMAGMSAQRPLQLAIITETYPPEINGVVNIMHQLVLGLERRGHRVHVVRPRQTGNPRPCEARHPAETLVPGLPIPGYRGLRFGLPVFWRLRRSGGVSGPTWSILQPRARWGTPP